MSFFNVFVRVCVSLIFAPAAAKSPLPKSMLYALCVATCAVLLLRSTVRAEYICRYVPFRAHNQVDAKHTFTGRKAHDDDELDTHLCDACIWQMCGVDWSGSVNDLTI